MCVIQTVHIVEVIPLPAPNFFYLNNFYFVICKVLSDFQLINSNVAYFCTSEKVKSVWLH